MSDDFPPLEFVERIPPSSRGNERLYAYVAAELRKRPGEWAKMPNSKNRANNANLIARGKIRAFTPAGHFEAVARQEIDTKDKWIFVRYVGGGETQSANGRVDLQRERNPERAARLDQMRNERK